MSKKTKRQSVNASIAAQKFEFSPDYSQVKRDLGRIGILASIFILLLVVLSFFQDKLLALILK
jgi:hypothetical protein